MNTVQLSMRAAAMATLFALSGCVLQGTPERNSRFSTDISTMQRAEQTDFPQTTWVYTHPTRKPTDFTKVMISPVSVYENTAQKVKADDRPEFDALAAALRQRMVKLLGKDYVIVEQPAKDVMRVDVRVTDIKPVVQMKKDGYDTTVLNPNIKGSKIEADCVDSTTEELIYAVSTLYKGDEYVAYQDVNLSGNISKAFDTWSTYFKKKFDEVMTFH